MTEKAESILPQGAVFGFAGLVFCVEGDFTEAAFARDGSFAEAPREGVYLIHESDDLGGGGDAAEAVGEIAFIEAAPEVIENAGVGGECAVTAHWESMSVGHAGIAARSTAQAMRVMKKSVTADSTIDFGAARVKREEKDE